MIGSEKYSGVSIEFGVENSPLNRYWQSDNTNIINNTFVDNRRSIVNGTDETEEKSLPPTNTLIKNNLFIGDKVEIKENAVDTTFDNNFVTGSTLTIPTVNGLTVASILTNRNSSGLLMPEEKFKNIGSNLSTFLTGIDVGITYSETNTILLNEKVMIESKLLRESVANINSVLQSRITASGSDDNLPQNIADGNFTTRWSFDSDISWVQIDLGEFKTINKIGLSFVKSAERASYFDVYVSDDNKTFTNILTGVSSINVDDELELFDIKEVNARYVRIVGKGNSSNKWNSYSEFEIYDVNNVALVGEMRNFK
jgi:hypothetical protein